VGLDTGDVVGAEHAWIVEGQARTRPKCRHRRGRDVGRLAAAEVAVVALALHWPAQDAP
jgi:hypothetical protein